MAFGQLTHRESLTDTLMCLKANSDKLYHLGVGPTVSISTLARANEKRSYKIYEDLAMLLIKEAKQLCVDDDKLDINLKGNVFAIDATTINLCLSTFYWASFRSTKAGIKLHTQLDLKTAIPEFILFKDNFSYFENKFRTPSIGIAFTPNALIAKEKGLLELEESFTLQDKFPHCSEIGI